LNLNKILCFIYITGQALVSGKKEIPRYWYLWYLGIFFFTRNKDLYNTNMSYYNLCGIGSLHSNISKGKGGVHIKINGMQDSNQGRQK
jgi:hypothetical protein